MSDVGDRMVGATSRGTEAQPAPASAPPAPKAVSAPQEEPWRNARARVAQATLAKVDALVAEAVPRLTANRGSAAALSERCASGDTKLETHAHVVDDETFAAKLDEAAKKLGQTPSMDAMVRKASGTLVDKSIGEAWLKIWPVTSDAYLEDAVDAALRLLADPPGKGTPLSTFRNAFGGARNAGVDDAVTALFTARVLVSTGVKPETLKSFKDERKQAEDLVALLDAQQQNGAELLISAYFLHDVTPLVGAVKAVWKARFADWLSKMQLGDLAAANDVLRAK